jgi:putrescine transport system ATP-binding protein
MSLLSVRELHKAFSGKTILESISFDLEAHQTLAILGRSGCGKTTLLKMIAGLLEGTGEIQLAGKFVHPLPPQQRGIVYLYQEALLFPHLNVFENIAFGLRLRNMQEAELREKVESMLENLGLTDQIRKMPTQLSGGQKQRVAFGRAFIIEPRLLLLDEPFGNLDVETRSNKQDFFKNMAQKQQTTAILVTHDLKEAVRMGDQLGYMEAGQLHIYNHLNDFIADQRTGMQDEIAFWQSI